MARSSTWGRRWIGAVAAALLVLLPLAGCAGPTPYSDFERERTEADVLPDGGGIDTGIDPESVRFVGTAEGVDVYIGLSDERGRCVVVDDGADSASGCSGSGGLDRPRASRRGGTGGRPRARLDGARGERLRPRGLTPLSGSALVRHRGLPWTHAQNRLHEHRGRPRGHALLRAAEAPDDRRHDAR